VLEANIQGNKPEEKITRLEAEIAKAPKEMVPILDTLLAQWYWEYFQQNRWRFVQRTATSQAPGKDFTTWDLARLFSEIDKHFQGALAAEAILKTTPITLWDDLLAKGTMPDAYRPTLYDFLAHVALDFYTSGEQAAAKPQDDFELSADSPVFDPAGRFIAWNPTTAGASAQAEGSPTIRAIRLYQDLLKFHKNDAAPQLDAKLGEQPRCKERSGNSNYEIADQAKPRAAHELASQPAGGDSDQDNDQQAFVRHVHELALLSSKAVAGNSRSRQRLVG
jgi:hypothetical protein